MSYTGPNSKLKNQNSKFPRHLIPDLRAGERVVLLQRRHPAVLFGRLLKPLLLLALWLLSLIFVPPFIAGLQPDALTPQHFAVLASGEDVGQTMRQAVQHMVDFLVQERGMESYAAYSLLSLAGDVRMSRTFRPLSPVKMLLARQVLEQIGR